MRAWKRFKPECQLFFLLRQSHKKLRLLRKYWFMIEPHGADGVKRLCWFLVLLLLCCSLASLAEGQTPSASHDACRDVTQLLLTATTDQAERLKEYVFYMSVMFFHMFETQDNAPGMVMSVNQPRWSRLKLYSLPWNQVHAFMILRLWWSSGFSSSTTMRFCFLKNFSTTNRWISIKLGTSMN